MKRLWAFAAAAAICACGSDLASPFLALAITFDVNKQTYQLASVRTARASIKAKTATIASLRSAYYNLEKAARRAQGRRRPAPARGR